ncbi:URC4/urg3 family protein [Legionella fallonii]|uniref:Uracil phosphoribosyltransferase n=1 Tax=Legionella fallonii LLAP-10 TaxID=1212491 RepID=A0A098G8X0_9GAMM|nr:URC4/urg3 family protein [Legionella fallonii]CEG58444.1 conserved protein of unknown function [Legionella fallonii LLAP-10]
MNKEEQPVDSVLTQIRDPKTIRLQAHRILDLAKQDQLEHFALDLEKMTSTASFVIDVIKEQYPDFNIPYHSRWRHFEAGNVARISAMQNKLSSLSSDELGKILYELVIISVFLDAGAGSSWRYFDKETNKEYSRSEGLALASLALYQSGAFSHDSKNPLCVDAQGLLNFNEHDLLQGFQVTPTNPLEGVKGRVALLNRLGATLQQKSQYFGNEGRLGNFYSYVSSLNTHNTLSATTLFQAVLNAFSDIWPVRLTFHDVSLGDVWIHNALKTNTPGSEYVPFHKLSQWLSYSLIEPLEQAGIKVTDLEQLTGLPEYRNGGLLIDSELLQVKNKNLLLQAQDPGSEAIVEWRALTVSLLDEIAVLIRKQLHMDSYSLPLAKILQGGTWEAGRRIAKMKRVQGTPPIQIISDGTIF